MSVIKSNMAALLYIIPNYDAWWPTNYIIAIYVFVFQMQTYKIFQKLNDRNMFQFKDNWIWLLCVQKPGQYALLLTPFFSKYTCILSVNYIIKFSISFLKIIIIILSNICNTNHHSLYNTWSLSVLNLFS